MNHPKSAITPTFKLNLSRYESDLLNEVLYSLVTQRAVKLLEVKVGDLSYKSWSTRKSGVRGQVRQFFFKPLILSPEIIKTNYLIIPLNHPVPLRHPGDLLQDAARTRVIKLKTPLMTTTTTP